MNFLLDPTKITNFNLSYPELELHILWWILAAGKNGITSAKCLNNLLTNNKGSSPFEIIKNIDDLPQEMKKFGIGCFNIKSKTFKELIAAKLDLMNCSLNDLLAIKGIGNKTARCFLTHSKTNQRFACLDTHVKKYLFDIGVPVPKTLTNKKYQEIEKTFIAIADKMNRSIAELDLDIWNAYSSKNDVEIRELINEYEI